MFKKLVIGSAVLFSMFPIVAMNKTGEDLVKVSLKCVQNLILVNKDCAQISQFFNGAVESFSKNDSTRPSHLLAHFAQGQGEERMNKAIAKHYAPASYYLSLLRGHEKEMDDAFEKKLQELKDPAQTWQWFDGYFKKKIRESSATVKEIVFLRDVCLREPYEGEI